MIIAVDFDGTIVMHEYPAIGPPVPGALDTLRDLARAGHRLILYTMRSGRELDEARAFLRAFEIPIWGVNENPEQRRWTRSPKAYAQLYIDDAAFGCPLIRPANGRPYVDWSEVRRKLIG